MGLRLASADFWPSYCKLEPFIKITFIYLYKNALASAICSDGLFYHSYPEDNQPIVISPVWNPIGHMHLCLSGWYLLTDVYMPLKAQLKQDQTAFPSRQRTLLLFWVVMVYCTYCKTHQLNNVYFNVIHGFTLTCWQVFKTNSYVIWRHIQVLKISTFLFIKWPFRT